MDPAHRHSIGPTLSPPQRTPIAPSSRNPEVVLCFQSLAGQSFLIFATLPHPAAHVLPSQSDINRHIQAIVDSVSHFDRHERWIYRAFSKVVAGSAGIQQIILPNPRTGCSCSRVHLIDFEYHWLLTEILNNSHTLDAQGMWAGNTGWDRDILVSDQRVITLRRVLDKAKVARMLVVMLVISPILGVLVGRCADSAEAGLAVSAGICALASFVQGLVAWILG